MKIAFWGSSLVSAYWNGAATYYRGVLKALAALGNEITFYEPDAYERQKHRDIADPEWARVVVYDPEDQGALQRHLREAAASDVVVKASGVGVLDGYLEEWASTLPESVCKVFWDVDAPATLEALAQDASKELVRGIPRFNLVFTYGGGQRVIDRYMEFGAKECIPVYNAFDPDTHFPVAEEQRFECDLAFLGNRLPDRESRVDEFFFQAAELTPECRFVLGGSGWGDKAMPANVRYVGHVYTADHNAFNCSARMVLNIARDSMASYGFSPATRVFEAAGAGACMISDAWEGIEQFLTPEKEILVAGSGAEVAALVKSVKARQARSIGAAARERVLTDHTYQKRARLVHTVLEEKLEAVTV